MAIVTQESELRVLDYLKNIEESYDNHYAIYFHLSNLLDPAKYSQDTPYFMVQDSQQKFLGILVREKLIEFLLIDELKRRMDNTRAVDESMLP